jgi:hypothetical protein
MRGAQGTRAHRQSGLSLLWFIFVVVVVLVVAIVGFRVLPAYIEYFSVEKALQQSMDEVRDMNSSAEIRRQFQRKADAGYIESVDAKSIEIERQGNEFVATIDWTRKLHLVGNMSLLLEFHASARR